MPKKVVTIKKIAVPIAKAGAKSVDPLLNTKKAIEAKINATVEKIKAEVDDMCPDRSDYKIIQHEGRELSVYLMWSDLKDNKNKFYIIQALTDARGTAYVWTRFGRVGVTGVMNRLQQGNVSKAINSFLSTERAKTKKGYTEIKMALGKSSKPAIAEETKDNGLCAAPSKLDTNIQDFVQLIFNKKLMEDSVVKIGYDVKKMPLGELSKETVLKGYRILRSIEDVLAKRSTESLEDLSGQFYTNIPHNFGMKKMRLFVIDTNEKLKEKLDLIQNLIDIQVAHDIMKDKNVDNVVGGKPAAAANQIKLNPIDKSFEQLKVQMQTLKSGSEDYEMIRQYVENGKGGYQNLKIVDCFKIKREGEEKIFNPEKLGNKKLLWHGSRFSNFVGILSQGLRIAPPEAPSTGYLFGKGVYFADIIQKSWPYACPNLSNNVGIYILATVALGNTRELKNIDYNAANLPVGKNSTHAIGRQIPDPSGDKTVFDKVTVPLGKLINSPEGGMGANEFIVYNTNQVKMEYIVRITDR